MKRLTLMLAAVLTCGLLQPAAALALSEDTKCLFRAELLVGKFAKCLAAADAKVTKGKTADSLVDDARCANKFAISWWRNLAKAQGKEPSENLVACEAATTEEKLQSAAVTTLLAFDRNLDDYDGLEATDLDEDGEIQKLIDSNNQEVCEDVDGTWANDSCDAPGVGLVLYGHQSPSPRCVCSVGGTPKAVISIDYTDDNEAVCGSAGGVYDVGADSCFVDITTDNQAVCEDAGGNWQNRSCAEAEYEDLTSFPGCITAAQCTQLTSGLGLDPVPGKCALGNPDTWPPGMEGFCGQAEIPLCP